MSLATVAQLKKTLAGDNQFSKERVSEFLTGRYMYGYRDEPLKTSFTDKEIEDALEAALSDTLSGRYGKGARPWFMVDMTSDLDPDQSWIGIEYETGFNLSTTFRKVVQYFWDNYNNTTVDNEGCGEFQTEFTFPPINANDLASNDYWMDTFIGWMREQKIYQDRETDYDYDYDDYYGNEDGPVGIHCNFSTPSMRKLHSEGNEQVLGAVYEAVMDAFGNFSMSDNDALFNRDPYDLFYEQYGDNNYWIEGKLFDSTDDPAVWKQYKERIVRIAEMFEELYSDPEAGRIQRLNSGDIVSFIAGEKHWEDVEITYYDEEEEDEGW